ncbi:1-deoxy-D-xylulose-5-phosphate synthase [Candidatus Hydrogenedentota bacterium]
MKPELLNKINGPEDIKEMSSFELHMLADEIREMIIEVVSKTGGHLASSLGVVELSVAIHKVFDSPKDKIVWDVGHQSYAHKLLTGRCDRFHTLRCADGISGFPKRSESPHDAFGTGHASTSISAALGMAAASRLTGKNSRTIAVIGDGSLTGGLAFEGLNHAGHSPDNLIVILNDNTMAISKSVGAMSRYLTRVITANVYTRAKRDVEFLLKRLPHIGIGLHRTVKRLEENVKNVLVPGALFQELGFKYVGPADGHNIDEMIETFENIKRLKCPVLFHVLTTKGRGYADAEEDPTGFHSASPFAISLEKINEEGVAGKESPPLEPGPAPTYTQAFADTMLELAEEQENIVGITAAMPNGTGLDKFGEKYPNRFFDVGIAEEHAVTFAAGLACEGIKPVFAVYSTFLQRAYDQLIHDICLQNLPAIFAIDRAGVVGEDGPTHHGTFDISYMRDMPGMVIAAPKDERDLRCILLWAAKQEFPFAMRYPRARGIGEIDMTEECAAIQLGKGEVLRHGEQVVILAIGSMVYPSLDAADILAKRGVEATVVDARFVKPLDEDLIRGLCAKTPYVLTVEEHSLTGGFGAAVLEFLERDGLLKKVKINRVGLPDKFIRHAPRDVLLEENGLCSEEIATQAKKIAKRTRKKAVVTTN